VAFKFVNTDLFSRFIKNLLCPCFGDTKRVTYFTERFTGLAHLKDLSASIGNFVPWLSVRLLQRQVVSSQSLFDIGQAAFAKVRDL
jgi:hypothetical protein